MQLWCQFPFFEKSWLLNPSHAQSCNTTLEYGPWQFCCQQFYINTINTISAQSSSAYNSKIKRFIIYRNSSRHIYFLIRENLVSIVMKLEFPVRFNNSELVKHQKQLKYIIRKTQRFKLRKDMKFERYESFPSNNPNIISIFLQLLKPETSQLFFSKALIILW